MMMMMVVAVVSCSACDFLHACQIMIMPAVIVVVVIFVVYLFTHGVGNFVQKREETPRFTSSVCVQCV